MPPSPHDETDLLVLLNAICDRFEDELKSGKPASIEQVLSENKKAFSSGPARSELLQELFLLAFHYNDKNDVLANDLRNRFPADVELIDQALNSALLQASEQATHASHPSDTAVEDKSLKGHEIGPYRLLAGIGAGGMGEVWLAERHEPYQKVALKLIQRDRLGQSTGLKEFTARFEAEREALAMMSHPNIAKILDGGTTDEGQPFFVMEFVEGTTLTKYCDQKQLSISTRLEIFTDICRAVSHAHQKGIIHRDLKPGNIIVTEIDGQPVPKVIDFGLAKATQQTTKLTDKTIQTQIGQAMGTWQYMSPEQAGAKGEGVDTRTDIFALGAILHELLVGTPPLSKQDIEDHLAGKDRYLHHLELALLVREFEARRPSSQLSKLKQTSTVSAAEKTTPGMDDSVSINRAITTSKLENILTGELDWVVLKATAREPERRYQTASDLADEIQRFLSGDAVQARPPSTTYRLRKLVRRNKGLVASVATIATLLVAGIVGTSTGWIQAIKRADSERLAKENEKLAKEDAIRDSKRSEDSLKLFLESFQSVDPNKGADTKMTATDVLFEAKKKLDNSKIDAKGRAMFLRGLGQTFASNGEIKAAIETAKEEIELRKNHFGESHPEYIAAMIDLAEGYRRLSDFDKGIEIGLEANRLAETHLERNHPHRLCALICVASAYYKKGETKKAITIEEKILEITKKQKGEKSIDTAKAMGNLASSYFQVGRTKDAVTLEDSALELMKFNKGDEHPHTLVAMNNLAGSYHHLGRLEDAINLLEPAFEMQKAKLGIKHPHTMSTMQSIVVCYNDSGRAKEALTINKLLVAELSKKFGANNPRTIISEANSAISMAILGDYAEAASKHESVIEKLTKALGPEHPEILIAQGYLADEYRGSGRLDDALELNEQLIERMKKNPNFGPTHIHTLSTTATRALILDDLGRTVEAVALLKDLVSTMEKNLGKDNPQTQKAKTKLEELTDQ